MRTITRLTLTAVVAALAWTTPVAAQDAPAAAPSPPVRPVLEVVMGEPQLEEMVKSLGLVHRSSVAVPSKLDHYSCVILNNENAATPKVMERLKDYTRHGGGVVALGAVPLRLAGQERVGSHEALKSIVDWFGCRDTRSVQSDWWFYNRAQCRWQGLPASVLANTDRVLGTANKRGSVLFTYKGDRHYVMVSEPDEFCEIVAVWESESVEPAREGRNPVAAMSHTYGLGRVYWQSVFDEPNYPRLRDLLRAGIWRAATGKVLPPELRRDLPPVPLGEQEPGDLRDRRRRPTDLGKVIEEGKKVIDKITGRGH